MGLSASEMAPHPGPLPDLAVGHHAERSMIGKRRNVQAPAGVRKSPCHGWFGARGMNFRNAVRWVDGNYPFRNL